MKEKTTEKKIINELLVTALANQFVTALKGCYRQYVSDLYLTCQLKHATWTRIKACLNPQYPNLVYISALEAALGIFEDLLEIDCDSGIRGVHMANEYAKLFKDYKLE